MTTPVNIGPKRPWQFSSAGSTYDPAVETPDAVFPSTPVARSYGSATSTPFLYICDSGNNRISVTDLDGNPLFTFGSFGSGNGQFNDPYGVCNDGTYVFVSDSGNHRVQYFDLYGNYLGQWGSYGTSAGQFNTPKGIATDGRIICVVDQGNNRFQLFTVWGALLMTLGTFGSGTDQFNAPTNCYIDDYFVWIDDTGNSRLVWYLKSYIQAWAAITLPMLTASGTFYGHWWSGGVTLPMLEASGEMVGRGVFAGAVELPMLEASGAFVGRGNFAGSVSLPMLSASGTFSAVVDFTGSVSLPMLLVSGEFTARGVFSADITLPMLSASGVFSAVLTAVYHALAVNTETLSATQYTNYPFNSMCEFNGKYYAAGPNGVTRLDGTDDRSTPIVPVVRFGINDLHKGNLRSLMDAYFTGISTSRTRMKIIYGEDETVPDNVYETAIPVTRESVRVPPPKGMKGKRFVTVEITDATEIDSVRLLTEYKPGRSR